MIKAFTEWYSKYGLWDGFFSDRVDQSKIERIAYRAYQRGRKDGRDMPKRTYRPQEEKEQ